MVIMTSLKFYLKRVQIKRSKDLYNNTPLLFAAANGHHEIVKILLEKGAEIDVKNKEDMTSLLLASKNVVIMRSLKYYLRMAQIWK